MLSQTCEYALRAVACLARQPGEFVTASALADATTVPPDYLSKVLQQLAAADVVQGRRGVGGGYRLARDPKDINLHSIVDAMGAISKMRSCPSAASNPRVCPLHDTMDRAMQAAEQVFRETTLADLIRRESEGEMCVKRCDGGAPSPAARIVARASAPVVPAAPTQPTVATPTQSRVASTAPNLRDERLARASSKALVDEEDSDEPVYTASGRLRAKPRRMTNGDHANGHSRAAN